jgi:hypothetical protein
MICLFCGLGAHTHALARATILFWIVYYGALVLYFISQPEIGSDGIYIQAGSGGLLQYVSLYKFGLCRNPAARTMLDQAKLVIHHQPKTLIFPSHKN